MNRLTFYRAWWIAAENLDEEERKEFFCALIDYAFAAEISQPDSLTVLTAFEIIRPIIDRARAKQEREGQR